MLKEWAKRRWRAGGLAALGLGVTAAATGSGLAFKRFGDWAAPVSAEQGSDASLNTASNDGCPIISPDGRSLYMASNRPGGLGGQDIWVAHRQSTRSGWGEPVNLGEPVNSPQDDFCPTPVRGKRLFFVSRRSEPNGDIYVTDFQRGRWMTPIRLGPEINSPAQEWSPSYFHDDFGHEHLYFSSTRPGGPGGQDIYYSLDFGPAQLAPGALNSEFDDARPNVRKDGLEIVFDSTRPGTLGGPDLWTSRRTSTNASWPAPLHLSALSSPAPDTRASLSWDGTFMVFGSARPGGEGQADIYVSTRQKVRGGFHGR